MQLKIKTVKSIRIQFQHIVFFISCAELSVFSWRNEKKNTSLTSVGSYYESSTESYLEF